MCINIASRLIGLSEPPLIIAEMSGNHNQSLDRALEIVDAAASCGAHALKLQTYTADTMTLDIDSREFFIDDPDNAWKGSSLYNLYKKAHTPWEWHEAIFDRCHKLGMICFSTPFDDTAVDFLESLNAPCYKIASFENIDIPLLRKVASTGKPMIISTGMATVAELDEAVQTVRDAGTNDLVLLKCTSSYPSSPESSNIRTIPHLRELFKVEVGLSDHTMGLGVAVAAVALGATLIEKHLTLSRSDGGVDSAFSLEPGEMKNLVSETERAWQALGQISYGPAGIEKSSIAYRRSLYIGKDMKKGDIFSTENIRIIRPGNGLAPKFIDNFIGKKIKKNAKKGTALTWDFLY